MEKPYILHMLTTAKNLSPFDVNMAMDAGWVSAVPYLNVELAEVQGLVQDAIFSRSQKKPQTYRHFYRWTRHQTSHGHAGGDKKSHGAAV